MLGENPFGNALEPVHGKEIKGKKTVVQYVKSHDSKVMDAQVVFVSTSLEDELDTILKDLRERPVLTISDIKGFADAGGMIEFTERDGSIHFIINIKAVRQAHLDMNFQLLQLADRVID